jgi:hypothetical protein
MRQSGSNITFSNVETHTIKAIEFGLMNPEDIVIKLKTILKQIKKQKLNQKLSFAFPFQNFSSFRILKNKKKLKLSVAKIDQIQITDAEGKSIKGGINDPRMGTVEKSSFCETCGSNFTDCVGHFGHIELAKPVFHVGYIEEIKKILRCICFNCSKLLFSKGAKYKETVRIKNPKKRKALMFNFCKGISLCTMKERKMDIVSLISFKFFVYLFKKYFLFIYLYLH